MKAGMFLSRRELVKGAAVVAGVLVMGFNYTKKAFAATLNYLKKRQDSVYRRDTEMKYRNSQDSPAIHKVYKKFLHKPNSHEAHHLLHTHYTDRSESIKKLKAKGIKLAD
jgi:ferredoxin hydrogenase small subunit